MFGPKSTRTNEQRGSHNWPASVSSTDDFQKILHVLPGAKKGAMVTPQKQHPYRQQHMLGGNPLISN